MNLTIKYNGKTFALQVREITQKMNTILRSGRHLCGGCQALVCPSNDRLASELVKNGVKTNDRYYVFKCDGFKAMDAEYFTRKTSIPEDSCGYTKEKYCGRTYSIVHPVLKTRFR